MPEEDPTPALLQIDVSPGARTVLALRGDLDPHTAPSLESAIADAAEVDGLEQVVIDLGDVGFLDSSGLRAFVVGRELLAGSGAELLLANASPNARRLLDVTGLSDLLEA